MHSPGHGDLLLGILPSTWAGCQQAPGGWKAGKGEGEEKENALPSKYPKATPYILRFSLTGLWTSFKLAGLYLRVDFTLPPSGEKKNWDAPSLPAFCRTVWLIFLCDTYLPGVCVAGALPFFLGGFVRETSVGD